MTSSAHGARRRPVLVPVASALAAAGVGVTALLGGLQEAPEEPTPKATPGEVIDQGQFRTQFIKAVDTTRPGGFGTTKRYLDLVLKVTNMSDATAIVGTLPEPGKPISQVPFTFAGSLLRIRPEIKARYSPQVMVLSYGIESRQLHPGMTTTVVVRYELEPNAAVPDEITVDVGSFVHEQFGLLQQEEVWKLVGDDEGEEFVPKAAAQVTLPVRQESA